MPRRTPAIDLKAFPRYQRETIRVLLRRHGEEFVLAALLAGQACGLDPDDPGDTERFLVFINEAAHGQGQGRASSGAAVRHRAAAVCAQAASRCAR